MILPKRTLTIVALACAAACANRPAPPAPSGARALPRSDDVAATDSKRGGVFSGVECPADVGLPQAAALRGVRAKVEGANVRIGFEPWLDAADYRVFVLPKREDVTEHGVKGAVYRCAGVSPLPAPAVDDQQREPPPGVRTRVGVDVDGFVRSSEDATLGYVFTAPGPDRLPVYAMGDPDLRADNVDCYEMRWPESRKKRFVASEAERRELLAHRWRDDGVAFYVPKPGVPGTRPVYEAALTRGDWGAYLYAVDDVERAARGARGARETTAFSVYRETRADAEPLLRVYYWLACGHGHDELVAGKERFKRARFQGASPVTELHFSGLDQPTVLVVEALDDQCPFRGILAPTPRPARVDPFPNASDIHYPAFRTFAEVAASSPLGELFINGQKTGGAPRPLARACVQVQPERPPKMDFFYAGEPEPFDRGTYRNFQGYEVKSPQFDVSFYATATDEWSIGAEHGELWVTYADWAADTNGKVRITPKARARLTANGFLHASMEVDIVSTQRRYPQLLISSAEVPVQEHLAEAGTVIVQPIGGINSPVAIEVQFCDRREWDVNNQCPKWDVQKLKGDEGREFLSPRPEVTGWLGVDRTVRFDVYASTARVFVFANSLPYACVDLPPGRLPEGSATVTFGDVLYHSSADLEKWYPFHLSKMHLLTTRHFSNLGFSSRVRAPAWDESRIPCAPSAGLK